jgi:aspartate/tyrosine/aromatic aminotransferase
MLFEKIEEALPDPIFGLNQKFVQDTRKNKVYLSAGIYMDGQGNAPMLHTVKKAQRIWVEEDTKASYLAIDGDRNYVEKLGRLVFGDRLWDTSKDRIYGSQSVGGTSALRIAGDFLKAFITDHIFIPAPTWANHIPIFEASQLDVKRYVYYGQNRSLAFEKILGELKKGKAGEVFLFHGSCHNPTGADLSQGQWQEILETVQKTRILPFFDLAYQGLGDGVEEDAYAVRLFADSGIEMIVTTTASKTFGLYHHRVGGLYILSKDKNACMKISSQIKKLIRSNYSNPPAHGAQVVARILGSNDLREEWEGELKKIRERLQNMRNELVDRLYQESGLDWGYLKERKGMFAFCDFTKEQVRRLLEEYGIYMTENGRVNVAGLNESNLDYVVDAISEVVR